MGMLPPTLFSHSERNWLRSAPALVEEYGSGSAVRIRMPVISCVIPTCVSYCVFTAFIMLLMRFSTFASLPRRLVELDIGIRTELGDAKAAAVAGTAAQLEELARVGLALLDEVVDDRADAE